MTDTWDALGEAIVAGEGSQTSLGLVSSPDPVLGPAYGGSDLRFIDAVLADLIVFARLNRLSGLEDDLAAAHARFAAWSGRS